MSKEGTDKYRLRVGDYGIIFTINNDILEIAIINSGSRRQIYNSV